MKKLIIALAAVALAVGAQASCVAWKYSSSTKNDALEGAKGYIILGAYETTPTFASLKDITDIAYNGTAGYATTTTTKPTYKNAISSQTIDSEKLTAATPNYYLVLVSADEKSFFVGAVQDATGSMYEPGSSASSTVSFTPTATTFTNFSGTPEPTPEPTSGLLLLLGVAGLALKRKQA